MKYIYFLIILLTNLAYSQNSYTNSRDSIYVNEGRFYKVNGRKLFNGTIDFIKRNGVIYRKEIYDDGYITNSYEYYNKSAKGKVYKEIVFKKDNLNISKIIRFNLSGEIYLIEYFDLFGDKVLEEYYENKEIVYSCEYKNGKKNGKEFCITKKCEKKTTIYLNGKKI
jgi:hypothetical protein